MKICKFFAIAFCAMTMVFGFTATSAALPEDHAKFLKNEEYKEAFGAYAKMMAGLKKSLSPTVLRRRHGSRHEGSGLE